jgi:hypothetical protein
MLRDLDNRRLDLTDDPDNWQLATLRVEVAPGEWMLLLTVNRQLAEDLAEELSGFAHAKTPETYAD